MTAESERDASRRPEEASRSEPADEPPGAPAPAAPRARSWRREGVPSDTVGTGSFFAVGCSLVVVAIIVVGVAIFLLLRLL